MLESWWRVPFRVDESENRIAASIGALLSPGLVLGVVGCLHELATRRTGYSLLQILFSTFAFLSGFGIVFGLLIGTPYILAFDRFIAGPRIVFILGATVIAAVFGGLIYGWWWVFAAGAIIQSTVFVALLGLQDSDDT